MHFLRAALLTSLLGSGMLMALGQSKEIVFETGGSWKKVLAKARTLHKSIFVDCYASWCAPCKRMDAKVYTVDSVADLFNGGFVCVKVQMDTSKSDPTWIQAWYADASWIRQTYHVTAFPTLLFFSPEGELLHEAVGYQNPKNFIEQGEAALDPKRQYFRLMESYKNGIRDTAAMPYLASVAGSLQDTAMAAKIGREFANDYIPQWMPWVIHNQKYMAFLFTCLTTGLVNEGDPGFRVFLGHEPTIDSVIGTPRIAEAAVEYAISRREVFPRLWNGNKAVTDSPNWEDMAASIKEKYGEAKARHAILNAKIRWYSWKKDWAPAVENMRVMVREFGGTVEDFELDVYGWAVFQHSDDTSALRDACSWMCQVLARQPQWFNAIDTYANLLYKLGDKSESLVWEEKAARLAPKEKDIQENWLKMKSGEPTWPPK